MRRAVALITAVVGLIGPAQALADGPQSVSIPYAVNSTALPGVDTGLIVPAGEPVTVTATGTVCAYVPTPGSCFDQVGPDGNASFDTLPPQPYGPFVLPGAPAWGLVARIGDGPWMQVGSGPTQLSGSGDLVFSVNDNVFSDNSGSFTATVSFTCYPGYGYGDPNHFHCGAPGQS